MSSNIKIEKISYVIPCFNESEVIHEFYRRVSLVASELSSYEFEFLFVNDGSIDDTPQMLNDLANKDKRVKVLHFAKNQGHQAAITAGMDYSSGEIIVTIDADLQDPPELVKEMIGKVIEGFEVVHAQRLKRRGETWFKLLTAWGFYKVMRKLTNVELVENSGDFRAFTRPVLLAVRSFRERHRFMRGIFAMIGFKQCIIQYDRDIRHAGKTKYPLGKMIDLALNACISFSGSPIRVIIWMSIILWGSSFIYLFKALIDHFAFGTTVAGWTSIIILLIFFTGLILFCLGIIGAYIGRIFEQSQQRPLYWLYSAKNIDINQIETNSREVQLSHDIIETREKTIAQDEFKGMNK